MKKCDVPEKHIRLACWDCFRDDMDGITRDELCHAIHDGWRDVECVQCYEESITVYDDPADAPPGYSVLRWYTHIGLCPDCANERNGESPDESRASDNKEDR